MELIDTTTQNQSELGNNSSEEVTHTPQVSRTGAAASDTV